MFIFNRAGVTNMLKRNCVSNIGILLLANILLLPSMAFGQSLLEEIVVTASKRDARDLQSTDSTISAFSGESLDKYGFTDFEDYADFTPGFSFQKTAPARSQFILRGVTLGRVTQAEPQNRPVTALYLNDVPIGQNGLNVDPELFDLERVEIVKGPQGSLFGDSAMAGAVRYITKRPNAEEFAGRFRVSGSDTNNGGENYSIKGAVNIPIIENVMALRASAYYRDNSGWVDNIRINDEDVNTEETVGGRASLFWQISEALTADVTVWVQDMDVGEAPREEDAPGKPGIGSLTMARNMNGSLEDEFYFVNGTLNWDLGRWGSITSLTGYSTRNMMSTATAFVEDVLSRFFGLTLPNNQLVDPWEVDRFTQELRLATTTGGAFDATIGFYYSDGEVAYPTYASADGFDQFLINALGFPNITAVESLGCGPANGYPDHFFCGDQINNEEQVAIFGEVYWNITDKLTLTAGGRWFDYEQNFDEDYGGFFNGEPTSGNIDTSESDFSPKFGISYQHNDDVLIYGSAAKGFRLGGVNDPLPSFCDPELAALGLTSSGTYEADTLWSYEGGAKTAWMDGRLILNGSAYHTVWKDVQSRVLLPTCGFLITQNASKQTITGTEWELGFQTTDELSFNFSMSYTDATLSGDAPVISGLDGDRAPYVPKWKLAAFINYAFPITDRISGNVTFAVNHQSNSYDTYNKVLELPERTVGNLRVSVQMERYTLTAFADNLWDERIVTDAFARFENHRFIGQPRTLGVQLDVEF